MSKAIVQNVTFRATPTRLYNIYLSPREHGKFTHGKVTIQKKVGASFKAFGGMLSGKILHLVPNKTIVQAWRSVKFHKSDSDSILILNFTKVRGGGQIRMVHVNVPPHDYQGVKKGWPHHYWKPMAAYLKGQTS